jgi:glutamyl-tRNA reductase
MSSLIAIGINHDTATVDVREKVAFAPEQMTEALHSLCGTAGLDEAIILSTCNRTEILASGRSNSAAEILHWLASFHSLQTQALSASHYCHEGDRAIYHMMKVASGLDSMILGEPQILGQLKSAYAVAQQAQTVSGLLDQAMQHTFSYAKKVRTQTAIGENPVSVAFAAVHLAQKIFTDLQQVSVLLIGAGETIDLVARHLRDKNIGKIIVANRTLTRAQELADQYQAEAILLSDIAERLPEVDMVVSSTASQLPILGKGAIENAIKKRKRRPMFMFDIAVPRDIEPEVSALKDVYLYTVDDLKDIIDENKKARLNEVAKADIILNEGVQSFIKARRSNSVVPVLRAFREQAEQIKNDELKKAMNQLAKGADVENVLENFARLLTNKLIHTPSVNIKKLGEKGKQQNVHDFVQLFDLNINVDKDTKE